MEEYLKPSKLGWFDGFVRLSSSPLYWYADLVGFSASDLIALSDWVAKSIMSSLSRELVFLILQFLDEEKFKETVHKYVRSLFSFLSFIRHYY